MLATPPILLTLAFLAQAELAPPEPEPVPAAPAPEVVPQTAPAPPLPAEPAPPEPESPFKIGFRAGADFAIAADIIPNVGYDFSPFLQCEVFRFGQRLGLAARGEFTFNRFSKRLGDSERPLGTKDWSNHRTLSYFDFAALAIATLHLEPVLLWFGPGAGLTVTNLLTYETEYSPGDWSSTRLVVVGALGIDVVVMNHLQVGLHGEYRGMVNRPTYVLKDGRSIRPLGDRVGLQAAVMYQF